MNVLLQLTNTIVHGWFVKISLVHHDCAGGVGGHCCLGVLPGPIAHKQSQKRRELRAAGQLVLWSAGLIAVLARLCPVWLSAIINHCLLLWIYRHSLILPARTGAMTPAQLVALPPQELAPPSMQRRDAKLQVPVPSSSFATLIPCTVPIPAALRLLTNTHHPASASTCCLYFSPPSPLPLLGAT